MDLREVEMVELAKDNAAVLASQRLSSESRCFTYIDYNYDLEGTANAIRNNAANAFDINHRHNVSHSGCVGFDMEMDHYGQSHQPSVDGYV